MELQLLRELQEDENTLFVKFSDVPSFWAKNTNTLRPPLYLNFCRLTHFLRLLSLPLMTQRTSPFWFSCLMPQPRVLPCWPCSRITPIGITRTYGIANPTSSRIWISRRVLQSWIIKRLKKTVRKGHNQDKITSKRVNPSYRPHF